MNDAALDTQKEISKFKAWFLASRPKTLPVSLPPILVGSVLAAQAVKLNPWLIVCALFCSLGIQIGTNLFNDALDFKQGADGPGRLGPKRMTQEGLLSYKEVFRGGILCYTFALLCGIPLMMAGGWPVLVLLLLSIACGYLYTGGPLPLAYTGLSDLFVLIFFGWVGTGIVYFVQTGTYSFECFLASTQLGLLAIVPHAINNLRDIVSDGRVNKRTLAVRFGKTFARWEIALFSFLPFALGLMWLIKGYLFMTIFPLICLPVVLRNVRAIWATEPSMVYNEFLAMSALCELIFACLLAIGMLVG